MWDLTNQKVTGTYMQTFPFTGTVQSSRVKYGGKVQHTVKVDSPIHVYGRDAEVVLVDDDEVTVVLTAGETYVS